MWPDLAEEALALGDEVVTFADLLLLGLAAGLVQDAMASTRHGLEAAREPDGGLSRDRLLEEAVAFRRARRLESGQDLRAWLEARQLTMDDWEAHLRRSAAARELATDRPGSAGPGERPGSAEPAAGASAPESELERQAVAVDLACGGWWEQFADLAARGWAAARLVGDDLAVGDDEVRGEATRVMTASEPLARLGEAWCLEGLRRIKARERALEAAARRSATPEAVASRVLEHATDWTELRYDELLLPTRAAANEALLCARDDGLDAVELAARAGLSLERHCSRHDSLPVGAASLLDGALADEALGPVDLDEHWAVLWLRERRRPSLTDDATRAAASSELLEEALERAGQGLIHEAEVL